MNAKIMTIIIAFLVLASPAVWAETHELENAGTKPGDAFYGLDKTMDSLSLALTFGNEAKAKKELEIAEERLAELKTLSEEGKVDEAQEAKEEHEKLILKVKSRIEKIEKDDSLEQYEKELEFEARVREQKDKALKIRIKGDLNEEQQAKLEELIDSLGTNFEELEIRIKNKKDETRVKVEQEHGEDELEELEEPYWERKAKKEQLKAEEEIEKAKEKILKFQEKHSDLGFSEGISPKSLSYVEEKITEAEEEIEKAESVISEKSEEGKNVDRAKEGLSLAKQLLKDAKEALANEDLEKAEDLARESKKEAMWARGKYITSDDEEENQDITKPRDEEIMDPGMETITGQVTHEEESQQLDDSTKTRNRESDEEPDTEEEKEDEIECIQDSDCEEGLICKSGECEDVDDEDSEEYDEEEVEEEYDDNILDQYGLQLPEYERKNVESSKKYVADASQALETSNIKEAENDFKAAYAYAKYAKKLAQKAGSGKYLGLSDAQKEQLEAIEEEKERLEEEQKRLEKEMEEEEKRLEEAEKEERERLEDEEKEREKAEEEEQKRLEDERKEAEDDRDDERDDDEEDNSGSN